MRLFHSFALHAPISTFSTNPRDSLLLPLSTPSPQIRKMYGRLIDPYTHAWNTIHELTANGGQRKVIGRMYDLWTEGKPTVLAQRMGKTMIKILRGEWGGNDGEPGGNMR